MMAKLHDTVAVIEDTWIKCLGDMGSYLTATKRKDLGGTTRLHAASSAPYNMR